MTFLTTKTRNALQESAQLQPYPVSAGISSTSCHPKDKRHQVKCLSVLYQLLILCLLHDVKLNPPTDLIELNHCQNLLGSLSCTLQMRASLMKHVSGDALPGHLGSKPPTCGLQIFPSTIFHLNVSFLFRRSSKLGRGIGRSHEQFTGIYTGIPQISRPPP